MKRKVSLFWGLVLAFIFGCSLHWPAWSRLLTIVLSGAVLAQVVGQVIKAYGKKE